MGRRLVGFAIAASVLAGCGGGHKGPAPATEPPGTGTSGPSGATGPDATPTPPPTPTPTATPTPTVTACDGLLPADPGPGVTFSWARAGDFAACIQPITDGHGEWIGVGTMYKWMSYSFVSASAPGTPVYGFQIPWQGGDRDIAPQPDGYLVAMSGDFPGPLQRYDPRGHLLSSDAGTSAEAVGGLPGGGSVVQRIDGYLSSAPTYRLDWTDTSGAQVAEVPGAFGLAISSTGDVLALSPGNLRWYDRAGAPLGEGFPDPIGFGIPSAQPAGTSRPQLALPDGSVVMRLGTDHPVRFAAGATQASPVPDWLTSRAGADVIADVRGGHAMAFATVRHPGAGACELDVEVLAADGTSCGTTTLRRAAPCATVTFGADRTVFATGQSGPDCVWTWWTGLLR